MRKLSLITAFVVTAFAALTGCNLGIESNEDVRSPQLIIQGFLQPGTPVQGIEIKKTVDPALYYEEMENHESRSLFWVSGATVVVTHNGQQYPLAEDPNTSGVYGTDALIAQAGETYEVDVDYTDNTIGTHHLHATTTVPFPVANVQVTLTPSQQEFQQRNWTPTQMATWDEPYDSLMFPRELAHPDVYYETSSRNITKPITLTWDLSANTAGYLVGVQSIDTMGVDMLRKDDWDDWEDGDYVTDRERSFLKSSGFQVSKDSSIVDLFWVLFRFESDYNIGVISTDVNYWDFFRTNQNGSGTGNDWDTGVMYNVEGGIGVWGSFAWSDTLHTHVFKDYDPVTGTVLAER